MTRHTDSELPLGDIDNLSLDGDGKKHPPLDQKSPPPTARAALVSHRSSSGLLVVNLLLVLVMVLMATWLWRELQTTRAELEKTSALSEDAISRLSSLLSATDESLNQSADKVQETLNFHMDEIRKLWAVSNERNKDWIKGNQNSIKTLENQVQTIRQTSDRLKQDISATQAATQKLSTSLAAITESVRLSGISHNQVQTQLDLMAESVRQMEKRIQTQQGNLDALSRLLPRLEKLANAESQGSGIAARLSAQEAATRAFDAWRQQLNVRLDNLEAQPRPTAP